ncbi:phosphonate metabolism protein PhnM [Bradyrhizobium monzae]|uniref:phosphonate metabolism protein PhnM n=1 Tax=Bradyrhizobium sp. Oc8 TaxID=2876780 RepID=UPI001F2BE2CC|nr:phosphonate metabolism protein PhnM [Bradyrhizobium sp. Oc8]
MRILLIILGIWLLINVLFVVIMIPPRKPRKSNQPRSSSGLAPVPIGRNAYDEDERVSLRHTIIAIAMGALFSLTPPLLQAVDDIKRIIGRYRKPGHRTGPAGHERSLGAPLKELRAQENPTPADGSSSREHDASKH